MTERKYILLCLNEKDKIIFDKIITISFALAIFLHYHIYPVCQKRQLMN